MPMCGYRTGVVYDQSRSDWDNVGARPIAWSAWYPARQTAPGTKPAPGFFQLGDVALDASLADANRLPVVLMSHGTGGTAESLGWLARSLATAGYAVIAANHHGNTGSDPYWAEGFLCWWERAADLSCLLSYMARDGFFSDTLNLDQVFAVGFSLGSHSVLAMAGAQTSMDAFEKWRADNKITDTGPREFPDAGAHMPRLMQSSAFRASWDRSAEDFTDTRIKRIAAIAPAPPVRAFTRSSLAAMSLPVLLLTGGADVEAPAEHGADWLMQQNSRFEPFDLGRAVGHYTFLEFPSDNDLVGRDLLFTDHASVDRTDVHARSVGRILQHFC